MEKMHNKTISSLALLLVLCGGIPATQAAAVTYQYTITGDVLLGDETAPNAYGLTAGDIVTAYGTFTADLGVIGLETGTVSFSSSNSGNSMIIDLNGTYLNATQDDGYDDDLGPSLTFNAGFLSDFYFNKTSAAPIFYSSFMIFDDTDSLVGQWRASVNLVPLATPVPVPAAMWLFGSGLLGLLGIARRRKR